MLDLIRDVPDTIWVAAITALALGIQAWRTGRREDRRALAESAERRAERDAAMEAAKHERRLVLEDTWREERRTVYAKFLGLADECVDLLIQLQREAKNGKVNGEDDAALLRLTSLVDGQLPQAFAAVALVASEPALDVGEALRAQLVSMEMAGYVAFLIDGDDDDLLQAKLDETAPIREEFLRIVRKDIGTAA